MKAKHVLFESPDHVYYKGTTLEYDIATQRSFIIFPNKEIWLSKPGETHMYVYRYPIRSLSTKDALPGRVWEEQNIISFWFSPIQKFGKNWKDYIEALSNELKKANIDITKLQFDTYAMWYGVEKSVADPDLQYMYYEDDKKDSPLFTYDEFIEQVEKCYKKTAKELPDTPTSSVPYGSKKTAWDSRNNLAYRQAKSTSESFYPTIFK